MIVERAKKQEIQNLSTVSAIFYIYIPLYLTMYTW